MARVAETREMTSARGREAIIAALPGLIKRITATGVASLDVRVGEARLSLRTGAQLVERSIPAGEVLAPVAPETLYAIVSPLSGVAYYASAPDQPPYIKVGDRVEVGQTVALIEAMKVFNEIHTDRAGRVVRLGVAPGQVVTTGAALVFLDVDS